MEKHNTRDNKMFVSGDIDTQDNKQTYFSTLNK